MLGKRGRSIPSLVLRTGLPPTRTDLGLCRGGLGREGLGLFGELRKAGGLAHGHVRQDLAVEGNSRGLQAMNELAIGEAVLPGGRADALNPQAAVLPLLVAAVALGVTVCAIRGFLRRLIELALGEEEALSPLEILLAPCPALGAAFYAWHGFAPLVFRETRRVAERRRCVARNGFVSEDGHLKVAAARPGEKPGTYMLP